MRIFVLTTCRHSRSSPMPEPCLPRQEALDFMGDYNALSEINVLASKHFRDKRLSMKGIPPKLRAITDEYLESKSIDQQVEPISILDENFQQDVDRHTRTKTKAAEVEHAIRHYLDVELDDDPDLQRLSRRRSRRYFKTSRTTGQRFTKSWRSCGSASSTHARSRPMGFTARNRCRFSGSSTGGVWRK